MNTSPTVRINRDRRGGHDGGHDSYEIGAVCQRVLDWRRDLHQIPEVAFGEHLTSAYVTRVLTGLGFTVATGIGGTGVVASLTRGTSPRAVALRCELDALPIRERSGVDYQSQHPGVMHACGHDGHMAMVLGAAARLAEHGQFDGTVRAVFQPAEEPGRGARAMIDDGLFDRFPVDSVYGIHNVPGIPAGHLRTRTGPVMAGEDNFTIRITGRGGHASAPHLVIDPLVVAAEVVLALQHIVSRSVDPVRTAVLSCTDLVTDGARNAIPTRVTVSGDTRSFEPAVQTLLERRIREISSGIARAHGATSEVDYSQEFRPTVNNSECVLVAERAAMSVVDTTSADFAADPIMASEDFGVLAEQVPGCLIFLGNGAGPCAGAVPLHSHDYDFNDAILDTGVAFLERIAQESLNGPQLRT